MEIGIVGLPHSGKTTIFNALTKGNAATSSYSNKPNVGVVKVPDERLDVLASIYNPRRVVAADVTYTDIPPPQEGLGETKGIGGEYLTALQSADALLIVVRAFQDPSVIHIYETIDPIRDTENILMEIKNLLLDNQRRALQKIFYLLTKNILMTKENKKHFLPLAKLHKN